MQSFADLPAADRWALAFYSGRFAFRDTTQGERIWQSDAGVRRLVPDMPTLTAMTPAALGAKIGQPEADAVMEIGRAACRERVCQYVSFLVVGVSVKQKNSHNTRE